MKILALLITSLLAQITISAQTSYYKLNKKVVDGVTSTAVSGGQFISFTNNACYESDRKGYSVGNGSLKYKSTENGIMSYIGDSYWGRSTFKFNADKSVLNVIANGNVYVYHRAVAPTSVTTCSLIRRSQSSSSFEPVDVPDVATTSTSEEPVKNPYKGHYETKTEQCIDCSGRGYNTKYIYHGGGRSGSVQIRCSFCHGKGTITKREYVLDN